ncbi:MAG: J domain-containing protein [Acetatifactor sp.]|nr:J domain-containing protein [Acetatifactor sp.]
MKKVLKIAKINILAIIALPLLLLATAAKLAAKAMEKTITIIGAIFILFGIAVIFEIFKNPSEFLNGFFLVIVCLVLGGIFTAIAVWILSLISAIVMAVVSIIISLLNSAYELVYAGYAAIYNSCKTEYALVNEEGNGFVNGLCCLFFTLLRVINRAIILFVIHALKIFVLASIVIVIGSLVLSNQYVQEHFGIGLLTYVRMFPTYSIVYGVTLYLAFLIAIVVILLSLGIEWNEWGSEMDLSTSDYEKYLSSILEGTGEIGQESIQGIHALDEKRIEKCNRYQEILQRHVAEIEEFIERMHPLVDKSDNYILRSSWGEYFPRLQETVDQIGKYEDGMPVEEFEKLMPQIDKLEELKHTIEKQALKAATEQKPGSTAAAGGGFFAGCNTLEKLEKRYRALSKTYHPDSEAGDEETFKVMTEEYEKLKAELKG